MKKKLLFLAGCSIAAIHLMAQDNIGIGNTNPQYRLDLSGRMRIRGGADNNNSAGLWLGGTGADATADKIFMGLQTDSSAGFYSNKSSVGWGFIFDGRNGNVGIGNPDPSFPISFKDLSGDKISLYREGSNYYGLGIGNSSMQLITANNNSDILMGYGRSAAFTENMRIKGNGLVGIKNASPGFPLSFQDIAGDKISLFKDGNGNFYGLGVGNSLMQLMTPHITSDIVFGYGKSAAFTENMRIKGNGNIGIGVSDPVYPLDISNRMRIRGKPGFTAGIWLNNEGNTAVPAFIGMQTDNKVGFYGSGNGWGLTMNTQSGSLNINGSAGTYGQVAASNGENQATTWTKLGNLIQTYYRYERYGATVATGDPMIKEFAGGAMAITTPGKSRLIISAMFEAEGDCVACVSTRVGLIKLNINGISQTVTPALVAPNSVQQITLSNYFYDVPGGNHTLKWELDVSSFLPVSTAYIRNVTVMVLPID